MFIYLKCKVDLLIPISADQGMRNNQRAFLSLNGVCNQFWTGYISGGSKSKMVEIT